MNYLCIFLFKSSSENQIVESYYYYFIWNSFFNANELWVFIIFLLLVYFKSVYEQAKSISFNELFEFYLLKSVSWDQLLQ